MTSVNADAELDGSLAESMVGLARLAWGVPIVFAVTWALAWKFGRRPGLLLCGHAVALGAGAWLMEVHERFLEAGRSVKIARTGFALGLGMTLAMLVGLYPLIRTLLQSPEPFIAALESDDPARRLAYVTASAYAMGSGALIALIVALRDTDRAFKLPTKGLQPAMAAALALAPVAAGLHLAFALRTDLADQRHLIAFALIVAALVVAVPLARHLRRLAEELRRPVEDA